MSDLPPNLPLPEPSGDAPEVHLAQRPRGPQKRPGIRLGPFYFVPQLRSAPGADPWSHRKGEPRPFALLWAIYLMVGALLTIFAVRSLTFPSTSQFVLGCRGMLEVTLIGSCILWPMVRLSQRFPEHVGKSLMVDVAVLMVPAQAVLWPMPLLTRWGWDVIIALDVLIIGWTLFISALLAWATASRGASGRSMWMLIIVVLLATGPTLMFVIASTGAQPPIHVLAWFSPFTSAYRLTDAPSGVRAAMTSAEWLAVLPPWILAGLLWSTAPLTRPESLPDDSNE